MLKYTKVFKWVGQRNTVRLEKWFLSIFTNGRLIYVRLLQDFHSEISLIHLASFQQKVFSIGCFLLLNHRRMQRLNATVVKSFFFLLFIVFWWIFPFPNTLYGLFKPLLKQVQNRKKLCAVLCSRNVANFLKSLRFLSFFLESFFARRSFDCIPVHKTTESIT